MEAMTIEMTAFVVPTDHIRGIARFKNALFQTIDAQLTTRPEVTISHHLPSYRSVAAVLICFHVLPVVKCEYLLMTAANTSLQVCIKWCNFHCVAADDNGVDIAGKNIFQFTQIVQQKHCLLLYLVQSMILFI